MIVTITTDKTPKRLVISSDKPDVIDFVNAKSVAVSISMVKNGRDGLKGDKGDKGEPGDKGDQGDKGDKGDQGEALNNTLELVRLEDNKFSGDMDGQGIATVVNIRNATANQEPATYGQVLAAIQENKEYTDNKTTDTVRWVAFWDATGGFYPQGFPSAIRRGDEFEANNAIPVTLPDGTEIQKGDVFRARINSPGQIAANWSVGQGNTQQSTESVQGTLKVVPTSDIQDENTTNNKDAVTGVKFWFGLARFKSIAQSISGAWTFVQALKLNTVGVNQYLRSNAAKEVVSVSAIPAADITTDPNKQFSTQTEKDLWNGKASKTPYVVLNSDYGTAASIGLRKAVPWDYNAAIGLYRFTFIGSLSTLNSNNLLFGLLGTAVITNVNLTAFVVKGTNNGVQTQSTTINSAGSTQIHTSNALTMARFSISGTFRVSTAGNINPAFGGNLLMSPTTEIGTGLFIELLGGLNDTHSSDMT